MKYSEELVRNSYLGKQASQIGTLNKFSDENWEKFVSALEVIQKEKFNDSAMNIAKYVFLNKVPLAVVDYAYLCKKCLFGKSKIWGYVKQLKNAELFNQMKALEAEGKI